MDALVDLNYISSIVCVQFYLEEDTETSDSMNNTILSKYIVKYSFIQCHWSDTVSLFLICFYDISVLFFFFVFTVDICSWW